MQIIIFIIILGVLVFIHELGHFFLAKWNNVKVDEFGFGYPPRAMTLFKRKGTRYTLNWIPFGGFVRMRGEDGEDKDGKDKERNFKYKKPWQKILILVAGVVTNFIFAWILISISFMFGARVLAENAPSYGELTNIEETVVYVLPNSPAEEVGLKVGDKITSLKSEREEIVEISQESILNFINENKDESFTIKFEHGAEEFEKEIFPEDGLIGNKRGIGIAGTETGILNLAPHEAIWYGSVETVRMTALVMAGFGNLIGGLFVGNTDIFRDIAGPVGIVKMVGDASEMGMTALLLFVAIISINLAILNLIPIPSLDGGRILFIIIERIKGSEIKPIIANIINIIGFTLLILAMVLITAKDILNLL